MTAPVEPISDAELVKRLEARAEWLRSPKGPGPAAFNWRELKRLGELAFEGLGDRKSAALIHEAAELVKTRPADDRDATIATLTAALAEAEARAMPTPRRYETVEEIEALPAGNYLVRRRDRASDEACRRVRPVIGPPYWITWDVPSVSDDVDMFGALICGPLPSLSTEGR